MWPHQERSTDGECEERTIWTIDAQLSVTVLFSTFPLYGNACIYESDAGCMIAEMCVRGVELLACLLVYIAGQVLQLVMADLHNQEGHHTELSYFKHRPWEVFHVGTWEMVRSHP